MLRCHFKLPADVMLHQLFEKGFVLVFDQIVKPDARPDKHLFDAGQRPQPPQQMQIFLMLHLQGGAGRGRQTFFALAQSGFLLLLAAGMPEIGGGTAHIVDIPFEIRHFGQPDCFAHHRILAAAGDEPPLVIRKRAEIARAKAATVVHQRKFYLFDAGHPAQRLVRGVIIPHIRQFVHMIQLFGVQRRRGRILYHHPVAVSLDHRFAPHRVVLVLLNSTGDGVLPLTSRGGVAYLLKGRTFRTGAGLVLFDRHRPNRAANIADRPYR